MLTRWSALDWPRLERSVSPRDSLSGLRRELDRAFGEFERDWFGRGHSGGPRFAVSDRGSELVLNAELPGVREADLEISLEQSTLTVRAERKPSAPEGYSVHRRERDGWRVGRSFSLPCRIDAERTTANLKDGILEIVLPKAAEERPRQISVRSDR